MNSYEFEYGLVTMTRVDKKKARNLYDAGKMIVMYMVDDNPESPWCHGFSFKKDIRLHEDRDFQAWVNEFEYYNRGCGRGSYSKYFVKVEDIKKEEINEKN